MVKTTSTVEDYETCSFPFLPICRLQETFLLSLVVVVTYMVTWTCHQNDQLYHQNGDPHHGHHGNLSEMIDPLPLPHHLCHGCEPFLHALFLHKSEHYSMTSQHLQHHAGLQILQRQIQVDSELPTHHGVFQTSRTLFQALL